MDGSLIVTTPLFEIGDRIKLIKVPPAVERNGSTFPETLAIFQSAVGKMFKVRGIDAYGHVEVWVCEDGAEDETGAAHSIWVEPAYLARITI